VEADVARFYCTNKEQIFETRSLKDIDTVRNMVVGVWSVLLFQSIHEVHVTIKREKVFSQFTLQVIDSIFRLRVRQHE
jgi:hypothetical protein